MGREIVTIHLGQAGVQLSHALWDLVCVEHGINCEGVPIDHTDNLFEGTGTEYVFREVSDQKYVPRALLVDLEPTVIDEIRTGAFRQLWHPQQLITGKEDAASNFARGYYSQTRFEMGDVINRIRIMVEQCENMTCFKLLYSANGGTGSGLTSALCERLSDEYGKKYKFATAVYPSPGYSELMVEPYNALLHSSTNLTFCDCVILTDNEALLNVMEDSLKSQSKGFTMINRVVANAVTTQFLAHRFNFIGQHHTAVNELLTNLIPYPRIHFPIMAFAPMFGPSEENFEKCSASELLNNVFDDTNQLLSVTTAKRAYISCALLFRGNITPVEAIKGIAGIKGDRMSRARFVDWCPTGFKLGINSSCPVQQRDRTGLVLRNSSLSMIAGNLAIRDVWTGVSRRFDHLYRKRAYVHWYVAEGMEEGEFALAREVIQQLVDDYESIAKDAEVFGPDTSSNHVTTTSNNQFVYKDKMEKRLNSLSSRPVTGRAPTIDDPNSLHTFDLNDENIPFHTNQHNISSMLVEPGYQTSNMDRDPNGPMDKFEHPQDQSTPGQTYSNSTGHILTSHRKNTYLPPPGRPHGYAKIMRSDKESGSSEFKSDLNLTMNYGTNCSAMMVHESRDQLDQSKYVQDYGYHVRKPSEQLKIQEEQKKRQSKPCHDHRRNFTGPNLRLDHGIHCCRSNHHCRNPSTLRVSNNCDKYRPTNLTVPSMHHRLGPVHRTIRSDEQTQIRQTDRPQPNGDGLGCDLNNSNQLISSNCYALEPNVPNRSPNKHDNETTQLYNQRIGTNRYYLFPVDQKQIVDPTQFQTPEDVLEYSSGSSNSIHSNSSNSNPANPANTSRNDTESIRTCPDEFYLTKQCQIEIRHAMKNHHPKTSMNHQHPHYHHYHHYHRRHHHHHHHHHHLEKCYRKQKDGSDNQSETPPPQPPPPKVAAATAVVPASTVTTPHSCMHSFKAESEPIPQFVDNDDDDDDDDDTITGTESILARKPNTKVGPPITKHRTTYMAKNPNLHMHNKINLNPDQYTNLPNYLSRIQLVDVGPNSTHLHKPNSKSGFRQNPELGTELVDYQIRT